MPAFKHLLTTFLNKSHFRAAFFSIFLTHAFFLSNVIFEHLLSSSKSLSLTHFSTPHFLFSLSITLFFFLSWHFLPCSCVRTLLHVDASLPTGALRAWTHTDAATSSSLCLSDPLSLLGVCTHFSGVVMCNFVETGRLSAGPFERARSLSSSLFFCFQSLGLHSCCSLKPAWFTFQSWSQN